jgi:hypothetical protein
MRKLPEVIRDRRKARRFALKEPARIQPNDWSTVYGEVVDLSSGGFRARCEASLKTHSYVALEVPGVGVVTARAVWCEEGEFGAKFIHPIDPRLCAWTTSDAGTHREDSPPADVTEIASLLAKRVRGTPTSL